MNGTNFRNEYKNAMEDLTPNSELIKRISRYMEQPEAAPSRIPDQGRSFYSRHKAILTAAATLAVVIGICAVGAIVVSHFNSMNSMTESAPLYVAGGAASAADGAVFDSDFGDYVNEKDGNTVCEPGAFSSDSPNAEGIENVIESGGDCAQSDKYYSDSLLCELAEKARDKTLTMYDLGEDVTIQGDDLYCQAFCSFMRDSISYTLMSDFENTDGEFKVTGLYIIENGTVDIGRTIDLIEHSERLEDYFSGGFSEEEN